jgi:hypothetical protein
VIGALQEDSFMMELLSAPTKLSKLEEKKLEVTKLDNL